LDSGREHAVTFSFVIPGAPRTKKNHGRIVQAGSRKKILPSKAFEKWNADAQVYLINVRRGIFPEAVWTAIKVPVNCRALFYREARCGDAVGYYQALADALQEGRIVQNDVLIESWDGSRILRDTKNPRIEVTLTEL
jgi:hypothetical protein